MEKEQQENGGNKSLDEFKTRVQNTDLNTYFIFGAIILVLAVGAYALFSPNMRDSRLGNPACGKIVVATDGPNLASNISPTLAEARYFLVVDPLTRKLDEAIRNPYRGQQPNPQIAYLIAGKGEEAVIVGSIDQQSYNLLVQFGIRVFGGYEGKAQRAVKLYKQARISQSPPPENNMAQGPVMGQAQIPAGQAGQQAGFNRAGCAFVCPQCGTGSNGPGYNGMCPACPNCQAQMVQQNMGQGQPATGAAWNGQGWCPQGYGMQSPAGLNIVQANPLQETIASGISAANGGNQAAFGFGEQSFICPACNWRSRCRREGNAYPNCPNCGSPMASDMSNANNGWKIWPNGQQAAATTQAAQPMYNQMNNQPNFWQGPESTGFFICPSCNWRMYAQNGMNDGFPQCPNCKQIMARGGVYSQNPNIQNNALRAGSTWNTAAASRVAMQQAAPAAPPIFRDAVMPHEYRGVCENCHIVKADIPIQANALMPHPYRGVCSNCHKISGTPAGAQNQNAQQAAFNNGTGRCVIR